MATLMGRDGQLTATDYGAGADYKVHSWSVTRVAQAFDDTGDDATTAEYTLGDPTVVGRVEISLTTNTGGNNVPSLGSVASVALKTNSGKTYTQAIKITNVIWDVEKRRGGPPQRVILQFVCDDTTAGSILEALA